MAQKKLYETIYTDILSQIHSGRLKAGMKLKTEKQLMQEYGVSRITSKKALDMLAAEGYIQRKAGFGSVVVETRPMDKDRKMGSPSKVIGFIVDSLEGGFSVSLVRYISYYTHKRGYSLLIQDSLNDPQVERLNLSTLKWAGVQGIILYPCMEKTVSMELMKTLVDGYKIVTINRELVGIPASLVSSDHRGGVQQMIDYLTGLGCRNIGYVSNSFQQSTGVQARAEYFETYMLRRGVLEPPMATVKDKENVHETLVPFFRRYPELDGVIMFNSSNITEIKRALVDAGRRAEGDVAIACWERVNKESYPGDDVACIAQPEKEIARKAVDILIDTIEGKCTEIRQVILPTTLLPGRFTFQREQAQAGGGGTGEHGS